VTKSLTIMRALSYWDWTSTQVKADIQPIKSKILSVLSALGDEPKYNAEESMCI